MKGPLAVCCRDGRGPVLRRGGGRAKAFGRPLRRSGERFCQGTGPSVPDWEGFGRIRAGLYSVRVVEVAGEDHPLLEPEDYRAAINSNRSLRPLEWPPRRARRGSCAPGVRRWGSRPVAETLLARSPVRGCPVARTGSPDAEAGAFRQAAGGGFPRRPCVTGHPRTLPDKRRFAKG